MTDSNRSVRTWAATNWWDLLACVLIAVTVSAVLAPFWGPGQPNPGDFLMSVHRTYELVDAWANGIYYPRFGINLNFGYSAPLFQYYPPLASYLGAAFVILGAGFIAATKAVLTMSLLLSGWGAYVYVAAVLRNRFAALLAGLMYVLSPYLLMVVYERGAVAESLTWVALPWLAWSIHRYVQTGRRGYGLACAALVAMTMLGHNATAMFIVPLMALYAVVETAISRNGRALLHVTAAFLLGAGLSAFYWAPAVLEMNLTKATEVMFSGATSVEANVKSLMTIAQSTLPHHYAGPERFRFSAWQLLAGAAALLYQVIFWRRRPVLLWFWVAALLFALIVQIDFSLPFWQHVPLVRYIQFPWRLYGLLTFAIVVLFASLFAGVRIGAWRRQWQPIAAAAAIFALFAWFSLSNLRPDQLPYWQKLQEPDINRIAMWVQGQVGYPLFGDYTLKTLSIDDRGLALSRPVEDPMRLPPTVAPERLEVRAANPIRYVLDVQTSQPWTLRLHRPYFPGWQVSANGEQAAVEPGGVGGLVSAALPAGEYRVVASFGDSAVRRGANLVSLLATAIWIVWLFAPRRRWVQGLLVLALTLGMGASIGWLQGEGRPSRYPATVAAQFEDGIRLLGVDARKTTICAGEAANLQLYWFTDRTPQTDYKIFIHVVTPDDTAKVAQADTMPFDGFNPMTRWEPGEVIDYTQQIEFDAATPPGRYMALLGLYDQQTMQNLRVSEAASVLPGDRVHLMDIEVAPCAP